MNGSGFDVIALLIWLASGPGAGAVSYMIINLWPVLSRLQDDYKRYVSYGLTGVVAVGAWALLAWLGQKTWPSTGQEWFLTLATVIGTAIVAGSLIHAGRELRLKRLGLTKAERNKRLGVSG